MTDAVRAVTEVVLAHEAQHGVPVVVGVAGAVAVGKTTFAEALRCGLAAALTPSPRARRVEVVGTDGFLLTNAELAAQGLTTRKGFPESYDVPALRDFVAKVRSGTEARVPVYSHDVYDILADEECVLPATDVVIMEGVNALAALTGLLDVAVYIDAEEADVESWYLARFRELRLAATDDPHSFYRGFAAMTEDDADTIARQVWREINIVNLHEHIEPSREHAHCVVAKARDHSVRSVTIREGTGGGDAV
jgi:type I pantothenate kinase